MEKAKYERFEKIAKSKRLSNYRIAKDTGVAQETLSSWKKGKYTPKADKLDIIADYLGVPVEYFYYDSEESEQKDRINHYYEQLKTYEVSAGNGRINETADTFKPSEGRCARIVGDSMLPTLRDGDYVRIVETPDVTPQDYAVVRINGDEMTIKHVEFTEDGMWVRGENKEAFEDRFYSIKDIVLLPVQVVGKATEIIQRKL